MKNLKLSQVRPGERFTLDGVTFVKLAEEAGADFVLTEGVVAKKIPFDGTDRKGSNNFVGSEIETAVLAWMSDHPEIEMNAIPRPIDLTSMDGMTTYGQPVVVGRILTIDEYRRYRQHIPLTEDPYWVATPWTTDESPYSDSSLAYYVNTGGTLGYNSVGDPYFAARPALYLESSIVVSIEEEDEEEKSLEGYTDRDLLAELMHRVSR